MQLLCRKSPSYRRAFTLIELLVVIAILVMMIAIVALFAPRLSEKQKPVKGADQFQGWLLIAKQRAKRDGFPRGIRLNVDPTTLFVRDMSYIEQLPDLRGGIGVGTPGTALMSFLAVNPPPGSPPPPFDGRPDLTGGSPTVADWTVQPGDLLEVLGQSGQQLYPIASASPAGGSNVLGGVTLGMSLLPLPGVDTTSVTAVTPGQDVQVFLAAPNAVASITVGATLILDDGKGAKEETAVVSAVDAGSNSVKFTVLYQAHAAGATVRSYHYPYRTMNYRIIRQPRLLAGEQPLQLPQDVAIDFNLTPGQLPGYTAPAPTYDLLFDPSGALLLRSGGGANKLIFWVRDISRDWPGGATLPDGDQILVAIYTRTGLIASHPPDTSAPPGSYFSYFQDGKSSGL